LRQGEPYPILAIPTREEIAMAYCSCITPIKPSTIPPEGPHVITEAANAHAMYLDGQLIGVARTRDEAYATLAELMDEIARETRIVSADIEAEHAAVLLEVA
jgi:hypothetical protein